MEVFSKFLSESDCNARMALPTRALPALHMFEGHDLRVTDWTGKSWQFRFSTRNMGHPRPVFTGEWLHFAQAMRLQAYDLLILNVEDGQYTIDVYRHTDLKIFGQEAMWIHVDQV